MWSTCGSCTTTRNTGADCGRQLAAVGGADRFRPIVLDGEPEAVLTAIDRPVDLFVSAAVFQHFPSQEYGRRVLASASASVAMAPGAIGYVQIRYDDGTPKYAPKEVAEVPAVADHNVSTDVNYAAFNFVKPAPPQPSPSD